MRAVFVLFAGLVLATRAVFSIWQVWFCWSLKNLTFDINIAAPQKNKKGNFMTEKLINRPLYMDAIKKYLNTPEIKVLIGVRRCGKSSLLALLAKQLKKQKIPKQNIVHIRLDSYDVPLNADVEWLNSELHVALENTSSNQPSYVLLDEVQEIDGWERVVRKLNARSDTYVFITGSNSRVLSGDLATFLAGRYIEIPVYPLNFHEYELFAKEMKWTDTNRATNREKIRKRNYEENRESNYETNYVAIREHLFDDFMTYGGMPGLFYHEQGDATAFQNVLSSIVDTVVLKDVIARHAIKDAELLNRVIKYVFLTSGNLLSTKKIVDTLNSAGRKSSQETIDNYIKALQSSKVLSVCEQSGISGKEILRAKRKYYVADMGLRNMTIGFNRTRDTGFQFEGLIYNELKTRAWDIATARNKKDEEIDFVAGRGGEKMYVQVSLTVLDDKTFEREVRPLERVRDAFPKYVVVRDQNRTGVTEKGVRIINVFDFLNLLDSDATNYG